MIIKLKKPEKNTKGETCYWAVISHKDKRVLGRFTTREKAEKYLRLIERFKKEKINSKVKIKSKNGSVFMKSKLEVILEKLEKEIYNSNIERMKKNSKDTSEFFNKKKNYEKRMLKNLGIKKLKDGVTYEEIISNSIFEFLENAQIENAVIGKKETINGEKLVWYDGTWKGGEWKDGIWKNGTWLRGTWENGVWENGTWKGGEWKNGIFKDGIWYDGIFRNGTFKGKWLDGVKIK